MCFSFELDYGLDILFAFGTYLSLSTINKLYKSNRTIGLAFTTDPWPWYKVKGIRVGHI